METPGAGGRPDLRSVPFVLAALGALGAGLAGGLARLGWGAPHVPGVLTVLHGPLMVSGFFGALVGLERAVAVGRPVAYAVPALVALGTGARLGGADGVGTALVLAASVGLVAVYAGLLRRQPARFLAVEALGAAAWAAGNARALGGARPDEMALWGIGFLVLTIAGERLELSRLARPPRWAPVAFDGLVGALLVGLVGYAAGRAEGARVAGGALLGLGLWLAAFDVARRSVRVPGLPRYVAVCLLAGYGWLVVGGVLALAGGLAAAPFHYDAVLHAVFVGFVLSMVFGHAPVIFPAVLRVPIPFRRAFYAPLALLHGSLVVRVAGDLAGSFPWRRGSALAGAAALGLFLVGVATSAARATRRAPHPGADG